MVPSARAIACPQCGAPVEPDGASPHATCRFCRTVVHVPGAAPRAPAPEPRTRVEMPKAFRVEETVHGFRIRHRWFHPLHLFLLFFTALWWVGLGWILYGFVQSGAPSFFFLFAALHVAAGVGLAYLTLAGFVNTTTVVAERDDLSIRHRPLPWPGNRTLPAASIAQVYVREKTHKGSEGGGSTTYEVFAKTRDGRARKLIGLLPNPEQGLFLEQEIERRLGIEDARVSGEIPRD